jgi:hypothetical protein
MPRRIAQKRLKAHWQSAWNGAPPRALAAGADEDEIAEVRETICTIPPCARPDGLSGLPRGTEDKAVVLDGADLAVSGVEDIGADHRSDARACRPGL